MAIQDQNNYYSELIASYLSGNATDEQVRELEGWVLADPENKQLFINMKKAWMLSGDKQENVEIDVEQNLKQTLKQISVEAKVVNISRGSSRRRWLSIAAAIALLLVAGLWLFQNRSPEPSFFVESRDAVKEVSLPDGSQITLNQASTLSYVKSNSENKRKVELKGDAFFDVKRDEQNPFLIEIGELEIEVLGTSFYVDARPSETSIQVMVESGSVRVKSGNKEQILSANESAIFNKEDKSLTKKENEDPNYTFLKTNTLNFEQSTLEQVSYALKRQYNTSIQFESPKLKTCEITAVFKDKSLAAILNIIDATLPGVQVEMDNNQIIFSGSGCN